MGKLKDLTGQRFGRWTVIKRSTKSSVNHATYWLCKCDCGTEKDVDAKKLVSGESKSCGCLMKEINAKLHTKHGMDETRLCNVYRGIVQRCCDSNSKLFTYYGGRGIWICDEWRNDFTAFHKWAMENGYDENAEHGKCTIDRIDNNGSYCPENCRIVSMKTQCNNRRSNIVVEYRGEKKTIAEWCDELHLSYFTIYQRIKKLHWDAERAFNTPVK